MPQNPSDDDAFADLFRKLPTPSSSTASGTDPGAPSPSSRRAAREAAARPADGSMASDPAGIQELTRCG